MFALLACATALATPPNIVVIFSDDHARAAISGYGSVLNRTPAIDQLIREGVRFDRHYTGNPICAPSRASLLTGKYSHRNGHRDNASSFDGAQWTMPKALQTAGYETAVIGKWHLVSNPTGFDHWEVLPGQGQYYQPDFITPAGRIVEQGYTTQVITDKAKRYIGARRTKPFFLLVGHKAPHRNWIPAIEHIRTFEKTRMPEPKTLRSQHETLVSAAKTVQMRIDQHMTLAGDLMVDHVPARLTPTQQTAWQEAWSEQNREFHAERAKGDILGTHYQRYIKNYLRSVASVDESVGAIMEELRATGQLANTIVVYTSDQGFFLGENGWYDKRWFYEPSAGTPLVVRMPDGKGRGTQVRGITENVDLAPTILEWAGVKPPSEIQGKSLSTWLRGESSSGRVAYGHFYESNDGDHKAPKYVAIATERHKLIVYYELGECELFDLVTDPDEQRNLYPSPAHRAIRAEMARKLAQKQREIGEDRTIQTITREILAGRMLG